MNYQFFPSLLVRTPLYNSSQYQNIDYPGLLKSEKFKAALFLASKTLFDELDKKGFDFESLSNKQKYAVMKYFNRACFRSTPFGLFSSFSLIEWGATPLSEICLAKDVVPHIMLDFAILVQLWERLLKEQVCKTGLLRTNETLYFSKSDLRYVRAQRDEAGQTHFSMVSIEKNPLLKKLLRYCKKGRSFEEIGSFLEQMAAVEQGTATAFIQELLEQQVLLLNRSPNLTGVDYADLLSLYLSQNEAPNILDPLLKKLQSLSGKKGEKLVDCLSVVARELHSKIQGIKGENLFYALAERRVCSGAMPSKLQQNLKDGLYCLSLLASETTIQDLENFKTAFMAKYDTREVPLLEVLDAQLGLGYGKFAQLSNEYSFLHASHQYDSTSISNEEGGLIALLFNEFLGKAGDGAIHELEITDVHLRALKGSVKQGKMPPSFSVLFRSLGTDVYVEQAGGCSALSLIGRFSCSGQVHEHALQIAQREQQANPDVIFVEVAHLCHLHAANINRRRHLRKYEIPVMTQSTLAPARQILLDDIMVSIVRDRVVLRSRRLNKEIIPRLSSAYNFTKNVFPVFRFLCDVQCQDLLTDFSFSLPMLMPGLSFYPRVRYKSAILQLAEWHFKKEDFAQLLRMEMGQVIEQWMKMAKECRLPRYFAYTLHDHFLVFDRDKKDDLLLLLQEVKNKESIVLREFPFTAEKSLVTDTTGLSLQAQYLASLYKEEVVYKPLVGGGNDKAASAFLTNTSDWLYFKIYCHPLSADGILSRHLFNLINKLTKEGCIQQFFWIRYRDPDHHLRLRMKITGGHHGYVFECFHKCLSRLYSDKLVHRFHTDTYIRELGRYSPQLILCVEAVFHSSSNMVIGFIRKKSMPITEAQRFLAAMNGVQEILNAFGFSIDQKATFCNAQFDRFSEELGLPKHEKPAMEKMNKIICPLFPMAWARAEQDPAYKKLRKDIETLVQKINKEKDTNVTMEGLVADLVHMHLNRLFIDNQRFLEMVTYFLYWRYLMTEKHRNAMGVA